MELEFVPFAHDYYIMNLPQQEKSISQENRDTLFNILQYQNAYDYKNRQLTIAPVIRLYGYHLQTYEKMCVHVHGFFPYFYIKIEELKHQFSSNSFIIDFIDKIHQAYCITYFSNYPKSTHDKFKIIYHYELVQKFDFYGAHFKKQQFLKLYLYDSQYLSQLVNLLQSGALLDYQFQAYESHLSYFMHFYSDCNLFGMSPIKVLCFRSRKRLPYYLEQFIVQNQIEYEYFMKFVSNYSGLFKITTCPIEIDCHYTAILNEKFQEDKERLEIMQLEKDLALDTKNKFQVRRLSIRGKKKKQLVEEFNVELTLSLNKLWLDEQRNRTNLNINQVLSLKTDKSKNCENMERDSYPSVNLLDTDQNKRSQFLEHLRQYEEESKNKEQFNQKEVFLNLGIIQSFFNGQQAEKELCKKSIIERFREYVTRKKDLLELIKDGENIDYEFDFDQKDDFLKEAMQIEEEQEIQDDLKDLEQSYEQEQKGNIFEQMIQNQKQKDKFKFRKKYKANKNNIQSKSKSVFDICEFCNKNFIICTCYNRRSSSIKGNYQYQEEQQKNTNIQPLIYKYKLKPPSVQMILEQLHKKQQLSINQYVYYSNQSDIYQHYNIKSKKIPQTPYYLQLLDKVHIKVPFNKFYAISIKNENKFPLAYLFENNQKQIKYQNQPQQFPSIYKLLRKPPTITEVLQDLKMRKKDKTNLSLNSLIEQSQYFYPTQLSVNSTDIRDDIGFDERLTIMIFDAFIFKNNEMLPDPQIDEIEFIYLELYQVHNNERIYCVLLIQDYDIYAKFIENNIVDRLGIRNDIEIIVVQNELHLIHAFSILTILFDPDFISSYDLESRSLYYLTNRAESYDIDLLTKLSRAQSSYDEIIDLFNFDEMIHIFGENEKMKDLFIRFEEMRTNQQKMPTKKQSFNQNPIKSKRQDYKRQQKINQLNDARKRKRKVRFNLYIVGRVLINVWRNVATDMKIVNYSLENVYYQLFKIKNSQLTNQTLSQYFKSQKREKSYVIEYYQKRVRMTYDILNLIGLIQRSIEIAKLYGCEYESVGFRGSQFKIESVLNRVTKHNDFVLMAATKVQVATQKILECMPLVIEPPKMLVVDPVVVLDFQSLYPSIMIAYNLCYSTCLGNVNEIFKEGGKKRFGVRTVDIDFESLLDNYTKEELLSKIMVTPNKVAFLKKEVREGILPKILIEFLMTRIMIKRSSSFYDKYPKLQKQHSFRQLAIKLFMNVMYGYCGASFSGRMPSGDIADSVVELGRTLLNQCIERIQSTSKWQAKVLYGDTDSLFVMLKGRSIEEAFRIGQEMAKECTSLYPYPIELKFEKVYSSMFLVAKKRYVGYKIEKLGEEPVFDGKGLEMIRRDGCQAVAKIMKKAIKLIFDTKDLSLLKQYMYKQWSKILNGHLNIQDFIIAKEVKLGSYANPNRLPAHAIVATKMIERDPMKRPKGGERIPYLVIQGINKNSKIKDLVVSVDEFVSNRNYQLNIYYYIYKQINAALGRLFVCFDVDINDWFANLPKDMAKKRNLKQQCSFEDASKRKPTQFTINKYFKLSLCILCSQESKLEICEECNSDPLVTIHLLNEKQNILTRSLIEYQQVCQSCSQIQFTNQIPCIEWGCPIMFVKGNREEEIKEFHKSCNKYVSLLD